VDEYAARRPRPRATLADVADHIDHVRAVAGVEHIGLGGDYDGVDQLPAGLEDVSCYPALIAELAARGWSDPDLARLTSGNILRVLRDAETAAATISASRGPSAARIEELDVATAGAEHSPARSRPLDPPAGPAPGRSHPFIF
jgi:membrane dipeptidase